MFLCLLVFLCFYSLRGCVFFCFLFGVAVLCKDFPIDLVFFFLERCIFSLAGAWFGGKCREW